MNKFVTGLIVVIAIVVAGYFFLMRDDAVEERGAADPKNATYTIEGKSVTLVNGVAEVPAAEGSSSKITTRYFGNEVRKDLNGDGREDIVFLLTQETGGSGTFFYVVAALNTEASYVGSQGLLLGDRITPQTTEISQNPNHKNVIVVNYADRKPGEPLTTAPSVGKSIWLKLDTASMQFGEVAQNFEGEANPSTMTLGMKTWTWVHALFNDGREIKPRTAVFSVTFGADGKFTATTDCNSMGGSYSSKQESITFSNIFATKKYCEGSQEGEFSKLLENTSGYHFTSKGELILDLKFDSGSVVFR